MSDRTAILAGFPTANRLLDAWWGEKAMQDTASPTGIGKQAASTAVPVDIATLHT